jgi:hypothetical protein
VFLRNFVMSEGAGGSHAYWSAEWRLGSPGEVVKQIDGRNCPALERALAGISALQPVTLIPTGSKQTTPPNPHGPFAKLTATGAFPNGAYAKLEITDYGGGELTRWYRTFDPELSCCWKATS